MRIIIFGIFYLSLCKIKENFLKVQKYLFAK